MGAEGYKVPCSLYYTASKLTLLSKSLYLGERETIAIFWKILQLFFKYLLFG